MQSRNISACPEAHLLSQSLAETLPSQTVNANTRWGGPGEPTKEAEAVSFPSQCSQLSPAQGTDWEQPDGAGREAGTAHGGWHCHRGWHCPWILGTFRGGEHQSQEQPRDRWLQREAAHGAQKRASIFVMKINIPSLSGHLLPTHPESKPVG